eukprot:5524452-Heterocapsa_arctica.AAC.1
MSTPPRKMVNAVRGFKPIAGNATIKYDPQTAIFLAHEKDTRSQTAGSPPFDETAPLKPLQERGVQTR